MPKFSNLLGGLKQVAEAMTTTRDAARSASQEISRSSAEAIESAGRMSDQVRRRTDETREHVGTRLDDLKFDLEHMSDEGNAWASSLLDIVHQVEQGTVDAGKAIHSLGDGTILFEGQMRSVKDLLADVLPTTGEVQSRIQDLSRELKGADLSTLLDNLRGQWNQYGQLLAETVEAYQQGRVSLERVVTLAQQLQKALPGSETAQLAEDIADGLLSGQL